MSDIRTYREEDFPVHKTYSDADSHEIRVSNTISQLDVRSKEAATIDNQIIEFNSGSKITEIAPSCFMNAYNLQKVTIQEGTDAIGDSAFRNCKSLTSLNLEGKVFTHIGSNAFKNTSLSSLKCEYYMDSAIGAPIISTDLGIERVTQFGKDIFSSSLKLENAYIKTNVLTEGMFRNCTQLTDLSIVLDSNDGQYSIDMYSDFIRNCSKLSSLDIKGEIPTFPDLDGLTSLKKLTISSSVPYQIPNYSLSNTNITKLVFDSNINETYISDKAFKRSNLTSITFKGIESETVKRYCKKDNILYPKIDNCWLKFDSTTTSDFKYGMFYGRSVDVLKFADLNNIPVMIIVGIHGCNYSKNFFNTFFYTDIIQKYLEQQTILFTYVDLWNQPTISKINCIDELVSSGYKKDTKYKEYVPTGVNINPRYTDYQVKNTNQELHYKVYDNEQEAAVYHIYDIDINTKTILQSFNLPITDDIQVTYDAEKQKYETAHTKSLARRGYTVSMLFYYHKKNENAKCYRLSCPIFSAQELLTSQFLYDHVTHKTIDVKFIKDNIAAYYSLTKTDSSNSLFYGYFKTISGLPLVMDNGEVRGVFTTPYMLLKDTHYDLNNELDTQTIIDIMFNTKDLHTISKYQTYNGVKQKWTDYLPYTGASHISYFKFDNDKLRDRYRMDSSKMNSALYYGIFLDSLFNTIFNDIFYGYRRDEKYNYPGFVEDDTVLQKYKPVEKKFDCWGLGHDCTLIASDGTKYKYKN